jgi:2,3-bisphosphoglycerate-dependent phosphoglycerate mutase
MSMAKAEHQLVLLRHGESTWNDKNLFTGWYDCPLSEKGKLEAAAAGKLLQQNNFKFDKAYSSFLQRAIRTLWFALEETNHMHIPIRTAWELNER